MDHETVHITSRDKYHYETLLSIEYNELKIERLKPYVDVPIQEISFTVGHNEDSSTFVMINGAYLSKSQIREIKEFLNQGL